MIIEDPHSTMLVEPRTVELRKDVVMPAGCVTILKFGGSVLTSESVLPAVVQHIDRHCRDGQRVVAVVSAFAGETDRLLSHAYEYGGQADPAGVAALAETGECHAAAMLDLALGHAGLNPHVLHAGSIGLEAEGPMLDATPVRVDVDSIHQTLDDAGVLVVPGFVGRTASGQTCLFGRGGSDLTAVFLAEALHADSCRLIKRVDGVYDRDPLVFANASRFDSITFDDVLRLDDSAIQHKAICWAQAHQLPFEVGRLLGSRWTTVGANRTQLSQPDRDEVSCRLDVPE